MKLRFEVDQAECLRNGIDCPKSIVTVEVDPANLSQQYRNLLADRLTGIDVGQLWNSGEGTMKVFRDRRPVRVVAKLPTFDALMQAVLDDQKCVEERLARHRQCAFMEAQAGLDREAIQGILESKAQEQREIAGKN